MIKEKLAKRRIKKAQQRKREKDQVYDSVIMAGMHS